MRVATDDRLLAWWVPPVPLEPGEQPRGQWLANLRVSAVRNLGGTLTATDVRLRFAPNRIDRALGGKQWTLPLTEIAGIDRAPRAPLELFAGGLARRLRITTRSGEAFLFVVFGAERVRRELVALLPGG